MGLVGPLVGGIVGGLGVTSASVASSLWQRCKISNHYKKCGIWCTSLNAFNYKRAEISNVPAVLHLHILVPFFSFSFQDFKLFRDLFKYEKSKSKTNSEVARFLVISDTCLLSKNWGELSVSASKCQSLSITCYTDKTTDGTQPTGLIDVLVSRFYNWNFFICQPTSVGFTFIQIQTVFWQCF